MVSPDERRNDYPSILRALEDIKVHVAELSTKVEERNVTAISWRDEMCKKFGEMRGYCQSRQADRVRLWTALLLSFVLPAISVVYIWGVTQEKLRNMEKEDASIVDMIQHYHKSDVPR